MPGSGTIGCVLAEFFVVTPPFGRSVALFNCCLIVKVSLVAGAAAFAFFDGIETVRQLRGRSCPSDLIFFLKPWVVELRRT